MRANNSNFKVICAADKAEILLYDVIGADFFGGITAKMFADELNAIGNVKSIDVRINSPGGDVFDGFTMFSLLRQHKAKINVYVDGLAASIASVIAMAGDSIEIAANGYIMIHNAWTVSEATVGDANEFREAAEKLTKTAGLLDKINESIVNTYVSRTGGEPEDISGLMAEETWMNAEEAVASGFADHVSEQAALAACLRPELFNFKHIPAKLLNEEPVEPNVSASETLEARIHEKLLKGRKHHVA